MRSGLKCLRIIHSRIGRAKEKLKQLFGPASYQCRPEFVVISAPAETLLAEEIWQASLIDHVQHWPELDNVRRIHVANADREPIALEMPESKLVSMSRRPLHGHIGQIQPHDRF